jgi:hypothetical protein
VRQRERFGSVLMPGDQRWRIADALEWLRRHGVEGVNYKRESWHYVFFEQFEEHWRDIEPDHERLVQEPYMGVQVVYRTYPTKLTPQHFTDPRKVAGGKRTIRCYKFFHDQKNYGPTYKDEIAYSKRPRKGRRSEYRDP